MIVKTNGHFSALTLYFRSVVQKSRQECAHAHTFGFKSLHMHGFSCDFWTSDLKCSVTMLTHSMPLDSTLTKLSISLETSISHCRESGDSP